MSEETVSREEYETLAQRVRDLEEKLNAQNEERSESSSSWDPGDSGKKMFDESTKIMQGFMEATMDAFSEATNAMSNLAGMDKDKMGGMGNIPNTAFDVMQKCIDIQKSAMEKMR